jgi:tRNA-Thr(GGU) m(6)t(6)A37 methyltransferase TsaA
VSVKKKKTLPEPWTFQPIGVMSTVYREKFGIPRQSGMVASAYGVIQLKGSPFFAQACDQLETFSHLWVVFVFHQHKAKSWVPRVRPPRLGGKRRVGVLASRSPHRPNPIGLSVVKLERLEKHEDGSIDIHVSGVDILDGTPILDIKPYVPYADVIDGASGGWAAEPIPMNEVIWKEQALKDLDSWEKELKKPGLKALIDSTLAMDPRPASQRRRMPPGEPQSQGTQYGILLEGIDVKWEIREGKFWVVRLVEPDASA